MLGEFTALQLFLRITESKDLLQIAHVAFQPISTLCSLFSGRSMKLSHLPCAGLFAFLTTSSSYVVETKLSKGRCDKPFLAIVDDFGQ